MTTLSDLKLAETVARQHWQLSITQDNPTGDLSLKALHHSRRAAYEAWRRYPPLRYDSPGTALEPSEQRQKASGPDRP